MRLLAQRAPLSLLKAEGEAAESMLFGTAGFLSADQHELAPSDTRDYLRGLWDNWWKIRARFETDRGSRDSLENPRPASGESSAPPRRRACRAREGLAAIPPARAGPAVSPRSR